jgi:hypothetical protein
MTSSGDASVAGSKGNLMSAKSIAHMLLIKPDPTIWSSHPDRLDPIGRLAVDEVWSVERFGPRKEGEVPFTGGR